MAKTLINTTFFRAPLAHNVLLKVAPSAQHSVHIFMMRQESTQNDHDTEFQLKFVNFCAVVTCIVSFCDPKLVEKLKNKTILSSFRP